jgi:hypothetical protein
MVVHMSIPLKMLVIHRLMDKMFLAYWSNKMILAVIFDRWFVAKITFSKPGFVLFPDFF